MKFDLLPGIPLRTGTFNALITPPELVAGALDAGDQVQRFTLLYISGRSSRILTSLHRRSPTLDVQRAENAADLKTLLDHACHTLVLVEHDPHWYPSTGEIQCVRNFSSPGYETRWHHATFYSVFATLITLPRALS
jgi:hypothetical protein